MRYWLRIPPHQRRQAILAGCEYDPSRKQWYVDEPLRGCLTLADFESWRASSEVSLEKRKEQALTQRAQGGLKPTAT